MGFPEAQFIHLARRLPARLLPLLPALAGLALAGSAGAIAWHHPWIGGGLLLAGMAAAGLGQAVRVLTLGLLALPFGFTLDDPARALAAMFLTFALAVLVVLQGDKPNVSAVIWAVAAAFMVACILPNDFSLLAYLIGIACFVAAGQGMATNKNRKQT
jgi:hypothetical protein